MSATLLKIHPETPSFHKIEKAVEVLKRGGIIIYPTDTVYGIGCDLNNRKAAERLCQIIGIKPGKMNLSFICSDLSNVSEYARTISNPVFKAIKKAVPGPYTFILRANSKVPKIFGTNKKSVGIRIPNNNIPRQIVEELGHPIISASLKNRTQFEEYLSDPELIFDEFRHIVDLVIDGGAGGIQPSTVIDFTDDDWVLVREGAGNPSLFY